MCGQEGGVGQNGRSRFARAQRGVRLVDQLLHGFCFLARWFGKFGLIAPCGGRLPVGQTCARPTSEQCEQREESMGGRALVTLHRNPPIFLAPPFLCRISSVTTTRLGATWPRRFANTRCFSVLE